MNFIEQDLDQSSQRKCRGMLDKKAGQIAMCVVFGKVRISSKSRLAAANVSMGNPPDLVCSVANFFEGRASVELVSSLYYQLGELQKRSEPGYE